MQSTGGSLNTSKSLMTIASVHITVTLEAVKLIPDFHTRSIVLGVDRVSPEIKYYLLQLLRIASGINLSLKT